MRDLSISVLLLASLLLAPAVATAGDAFEEVFGPVQAAEPEDISIKQPFIGTFRGSTMKFDDGETEYYFELDYSWWNGEKNFVTYTVTMVIPDQGRRILRSQGLYGFDPFSNRLQVYGVFSGGTSGQGYIGSFDHAQGTHEVFARSMDAEGVVTWVRDGFEVLGRDRWRNTTRIRRGDDEQWQEVHQDIYTRVASSVDG